MIWGYPYFWKHPYDTYIHRSIYVYTCTLVFDIDIWGTCTLWFFSIQFFRFGIYQIPTCAIQWWDRSNVPYSSFPEGEGVLLRPTVNQAQREEQARKPENFWYFFSSKFFHYIIQVYNTGEVKMYTTTEGFCYRRDINGGSLSYEDPQSKRLMSWHLPCRRRPLGGRHSASWSWISWKSLLHLFCVDSVKNEPVAVFFLIFGWETDASLIGYFMVLAAKKTCFRRETEELGGLGMLTTRCVTWGSTWSIWVNTSHSATNRWEICVTRNKHSQYNNTEAALQEHSK